MSLLRRHSSSPIFDDGHAELFADTLVVVSSDDDDDNDEKAHGDNKCYPAPYMCSHRFVLCVFLCASYVLSCVCTGSICFIHLDLFCTGWWVLFALSLF